MFFLVAVTAVAQGTQVAQGTLKKPDGHVTGEISLPKPAENKSNDPASLGVGGSGSETVDSLAVKIKAKYPAYAHLDNQLLVSKFVAKYPQYKAALIPSKSKAAATSASDEWQVVDLPTNYSPTSPVGGSSRSPLTLKDVLAMVRDKRSTTAIIARIQHSRGEFGTLSEKELTAEGIPQVVVFEMREANFLSYLNSMVPDSQPDDALSNQDVLLMLNAGLPDNLIVAKIKASRCSFDTSPSALGALKVKQVPGSVLMAMVDAPSAPPKSSQLVTSAAPTTTASMNDLQYLQTFTACGEFIKRNYDFIKAGVRYYNSHLPEDRDAFIAWFGENQGPLLTAKKSCDNDPDVQNDARASSEASVLPEVSLEFLGRALLDQQNEYYVDLIKKYNQLVVLYNSNLDYVRSMAYRLSIAQYFTNMFQRPQPRTLNCNTSEDNGFGTTTSCTW